MNELPIQVLVSLKSQDDPDYNSELIQQLVNDLRELDSVQNVEPGPAELPAGAKGAGLDFGAILVSVAQAGGLTALATTLTAWVAGERSRTLKLSVNNSSIELSGLSSTQQVDLINWFKTQAARPA